MPMTALTGSRVRERRLALGLAAGGSGAGGGDFGLVPEPDRAQPAPDRRRRFWRGWRRCWGVDAEALAEGAEGALVDGSARGGGRGAGRRGRAGPDRGFRRALSGLGRRLLARSAPARAGSWSGRLRR